MLIVGVDPEPAKVKEVPEWCKNYFDDLKPHAVGGAYVNFMMEEGEARIKDSYKEIMKG